MPEAPQQQIAILGAGSWGTALAWLLGGKGLAVRLWCRRPEQAARINETGENTVAIPDLPLPSTVTATSDIRAAVDEAELVVVAVPAQAVRETLRAAGALFPRSARLLLVAKGLEQGTGKRMSEVAVDELPSSRRMAVLSGPNLAGEVVRSIPTATVVAASQPDLAQELALTLSTPAFRVYTNRDVAGVELGGALKNPIAIAAGIGDGLGFGNNTKATLLTRGLAEITRLGVAAGGLAHTFGGLSGLGDLIATANSPLSRNYRLGLALGQGVALEQALQSLGHVAEGAPTTEAACRLAERVGIDAPIFQELRAVLYEGKPARDAVNVLMTRPYRDEDAGA